MLPIKLLVPFTQDQVSLPVLLGVSGVTALCLYAAVRKPRKTSTSTDSTTTARVIHDLKTTSRVLGDLLEIVANEQRFHDWVSDNCLHFQGDPWRMRLIGHVDTIVFSTPDAFDDVLVKQFEIFPHGEQINDALRDVFGNSILTFDGELWHRQRKTAAKFFTGKALRVCMLHTMHKNVQQFFEALDRSIADQESLDFSNLFHQFMLQTFTEIGLGVNFKWIGSKEPHPFEDFVHSGSPLLMTRLRTPGFYWKLQRFLRIGVEGKFVGVRETTRAWFRSVINQSVEAISKRRAAALSDHAGSGKGKATETDETAIKSVVELFMEHSDEDKVGLRVEDLVDFLLSFVLAALDTSAVTLTWFFLMLSNHPSVEQRIRQEMNDVLPSLGATEETYLTTDHIQKLVYLEATIREVLRLYTVVPVTRREASQDTVICGDVHVKKGDYVLLSAYALARNPSVWGPDADQFNPSRWIDAKTGELLAVPPTKFPAFGAGPRQCIGMKLGMLELRVLAANMLHRYKFTLATPNDGKYTGNVAMSLLEPLKMRVERIVLMGA